MLVGKSRRTRNNLPDFKDESGFWVGSYLTTTDDEYIQSRTKAFNLWLGVCSRSKIGGWQQIHNPNYLGTKNLFNDFQSFAEWCVDQHGYLNIDEKGNSWQIDKDLFGSDYSPDTCVFIPAALNTLLKGDEAKGVTIDNHAGRIKKYSVRYFKYKQGYTGRERFYTEDEARHAWLRNRKESLIEASLDTDLSERVRSKLKFMGC